MKGLPEAWAKESSNPTPPVMGSTQRPNSLFGDPTSNSDLKDLYLQDLSDGMLTT